MCLSGVPVFKEAAKALRGETMVGLFADRQAEIWYSANFKIMCVYHTGGIYHIQHASLGAGT